MLALQLPPPADPPRRMGPRQGTRRHRRSHPTRPHRPEAATDPPPPLPTPTRLRIRWLSLSKPQPSPPKTPGSDFDKLNHRILARSPGRQPPPPTNDPRTSSPRSRATADPSEYP